MKRTYHGLIILAALLALLAGCAPGGGFSEKAKQNAGNVFRYPLVTSPTTLDPHMVQDGDTIDLLFQVYEGLIYLGEDNTIQPLLAERWDVSPDGLTYTFVLKEGATFHNGEPVTAEDVKWSWERATHPALASPVASAYMNDIVGVDERVNAWAGGQRPEPPALTGVRVIDPGTLEVQIKRPTPYFLGKMIYLCTAVLPKDSVPTDGPITSVEQSIGTGPFRMAEYVPDQLVRLEAFADYHGGTPLLEGIERPIIGDAVTRLNKFKSGEIDLVQIERQDVAGVQADPELKDRVRFFDRPATWYVGLNSLYPPFNDRRVRRAIGMAIDRESIVNEVLGGVNTVANSILPPAIPGHRPEAEGALPFDVPQAQQLLAEAGFPGGQGFPKVEMTFREDRPDIQRVAESVAAQLRENLGIEITLRTMEWGAYLERYNRKEQVFFHMRWGADFLDPQNFLSHMLATNGPENKIGYSNPDFDRLTGEADGLLDAERRLQLYQQAEDIALQDAPWIPIYFQRDAELHSPALSGLRESALGHLPHLKVRLNRE